MFWLYLLLTFSERLQRPSQIFADPHLLKLQTASVKRKLNKTINTKRHVHMHLHMTWVNELKQRAERSKSEISMTGKNYTRQLHTSLCYLSVYKLSFINNSLICQKTVITTHLGKRALPERAKRGESGRKRLGSWNFSRWATSISKMAWPT